MKSILLAASLMMPVTTVFAQNNFNLPEGWVVKQSVSRPMGKIFVSGGILCAPDLTNPQNKYNYGYTLIPGETVQVVEYTLTPDNKGPAGVLAEREGNENMQAGLLQLDESKTKVSKRKFSFLGIQWILVQKRMPMEQLALR